MKPAVSGVLLVPAEGDPRGLLREGPCAYRPPMAERWPHEAWRPWCPGTMEARRRYPGYRRGLVLVWDGKVIPPGLDQATRAVEFVPQWWLDAPALGDRSWSREEVVDWVALALAEKLDCMVVFVDEEGREIGDG